MTELNNITDAEIREVKAAGVMNGNDATVRLYIRECKRHNVSPLDKLIVPLTLGGRTMFHTSIDLCRMRAAATGEYAGSDDAVFNDSKDATVKVYRIVQGHKCEFSATARFDEYTTGRGVWKSKPHIMISKCAEMLALRKGFPGQLSGLYESAELDAAKESIVNELDTKELLRKAYRSIVTLKPEDGAEAFIEWVCDPKKIAGTRDEAKLDEYLERAEALLKLARKEHTGPLAWHSMHGLKEEVVS